MSWTTRRTIFAVALLGVAFVARSVAANDNAAVQRNATFSVGSFQNDTECIAQGKLLDENANLDAGKPTSRCDGNTCRVDYRTTSAEMQRECHAAQGQFWERSIAVTCFALTDPSQTALYFEYWNIPTCLGASCNRTVAEYEFDAFVPDDFEDSLAEQRNLSCTAQATPATSGGARGLHSFISPWTYGGLVWMWWLGMLLV